MAYGWLGGLAAAAVLLIAIGIRPAGPARPGPPEGGSVARGAADNSRGGGTQPDGTSEFIPWPGASTLPPLESGQLVSGGTTLSFSVTVDTTKFES